MRGLWLTVALMTLMMTGGVTYLATRPTPDEVLIAKISDLQIKANAAKFQAEISEQKLQRLGADILPGAQQGSELKTLQANRDEARWESLADLNSSIAALRQLAEAQRELLHR